jgi:hypothetical protein
MYFLVFSFLFKQLACLQNSSVSVLFGFYDLTCNSSSADHYHLRSLTFNDCLSLQVDPMVIHSASDPRPL